MAEIRSVDINIKVSGAGDGTTVPPQPTPPSKPKPPKQGTKSDKSNLSNVTSVLLHEAYNYAKQEVISIASYEINKYFTLTDDYIGQRNLSVAKSVISKAVGIGTTIGAGFATGGVVGGAIAIIGSGVTLATDIYQNYDNERIKLMQQNAQLAYSRQRLGYSLTSESIGENL